MTRTAHNESPLSPAPSRLLPRLSLRVNFSWTLVGNLIYAACQWGMLVVLARLGSPEVVGQFALGLAIATPVMMLTNLQLRYLQAIDAQQEYRFADYLGLRLLSVVLALLLIAGIVIWSGYGVQTASIVLAVGLAKIFEGVSDIFHGLFQQRERMDRVATSKVIKGIASLLALAVVVYVTGNVFWGTLAMAGVWALVLLGYDGPTGRKLLRRAEAPADNEEEADAADAATTPVEPQSLRPRWHIPTLTGLVWKAFPLGIVTLLISLNTNIPRYFIEGQLGTSALGIFAALAYLVVAGNMVIMALGQSASPRLARYYAAADYKAFRTLLLKLVGFGALIGVAAVVGALLLGRPAITLLYGAEYARQDLLVLLMIVAGLSYIASFLNYGVGAARYFKVQVPLFLCVTGTTTLASFWLIPTMELTGAAVALILSVIVQISGNLLIITHALYGAARRPAADEAQQPDAHL